MEEALHRAAHRRRDHYDIFLSQTIRDAEIVLGVYDVLTEAGYSVFCDWIEAPLKDRHEVSPANAAYVRSVMGICDTLLFIDGPGAAQSLWMCWELGWFDGARGPVAILPVTNEPKAYYYGREFLSLYPYVTVDEKGRLSVVRPAVPSPNGFMIIESPNWTAFDAWKSGKRGMRPRVYGPWRS
ncbi:hypothetical protein [Brevundimonas sp.]|uniref:hypothetical protein n=1 Tax=Brevundimonas sp. TaxID=1871086 RepID=UPI0028A0397F|nr:hypothetical protein [Brevundimonas sp.]